MNPAASFYPIIIAPPYPEDSGELTGAPAVIVAIIIVAVTVFSVGLTAWIIWDSWRNR